MGRMWQGTPSGGDSLWRGLPLEGTPSGGDSLWRGLTVGSKSWLSKFRMRLSRSNTSCVFCTCGHKCLGNLNADHSLDAGIGYKKKTKKLHHSSHIRLIRRTQPVSRDIGVHN